MKPGDLVKWVYSGSWVPVEADELLWSQAMSRWVPVGGLSLVVATEGSELHWLNQQGLYTAYVTDCQADPRRGLPTRIVPREVT